MTEQEIRKAVKDGVLDAFMWVGLAVVATLLLIPTTRTALLDIFHTLGK